MIQKYNYALLSKKWDFDYQGIDFTDKNKEEKNRKETGSRPAIEARWSPTTIMAGLPNLFFFFSFLFLLFIVFFHIYIYI
jgi:hypothetical protein